MLCVRHSGSSNHQLMEVKVNPYHMATTNVRRILPPTLIIYVYRKKKLNSNSAPCLRLLEEMVMKHCRCGYIKPNKNPAICTALAQRVQHLLTLSHSLKTCGGHKTFTSTTILSKHSGNTSSVGLHPENPLRVSSLAQNVPNVLEMLTYE